MSALVDLKVPLEALSYRFRKLQKHLSRDTDAEIKRIEDLRDIFSSDEYEAICTRLHGLRSLVISADTAEKGCLERLRARIDAAVEQKLSTEDKTIIMVADYLLRLREFDCVEHLVDEYRDGQLRPHFNIPEHREAHVVEAAIAAGDLDPALQWCQSHASKLRRVVSVLEFYISQEKFLDLVYANNPQEALKFAQNHLAVLINTAAEPKAAKRNAQSQASTNEKRLRAVSMGSYASTPDTELARVLEVTAATPSYEEFGCTNNDWSSKRQNIQATPEPELKSNLRCLTSLLVYPSTSPEVMNHPRYGPWARQKRLSKIQEIFQNDFRQVYGFPEISPLETYLTTGVAVLKTPTCSAILNGGELNYAGKDSASSTTNAFSAIVSNRLRDSAPIGVDQASSGDSRQRPAAPFFDRLSNIGNLLNSNSRRARSQSLSAIEEKFDMTGEASSMIGLTGRTIDLPQASGIAQSQSGVVDMVTKNHMQVSGSQCNLSVGACNNDVTAATSAVILDHPCYHTSRRDHVVSESLLSRGKRRADGCPVCSSLGGVGYAIAKAAPCFASPVSMLLCRGSGALMTHDNPPMALPNGQVFSRNFLLASAIKKEISDHTGYEQRQMDRNVSIAPLNNPPSIRLSLPRLSLRHPRDLTAGEEESRWSVLRRLAARSLTRENSSIRDNASGSAAIPPASQQTQAIATIRTTRGVEQTTSRNRALSPIIDNARRHLERSSHIPEGAVSEDYDNEESNSGESILEESPMDSALEDDDYYSEEEKEEKEGDVEDDVYEHDNDMGLYERIWQGRRSAADLSYRRNEVLLSTSSCSTQHILDHQNLAGSEEAKLISDIPNTVLFAVCPVTGDHFEFSTLRTVFLA